MWEGVALTEQQALVNLLDEILENNGITYNNIALNPDGTVTIVGVRNVPYHCPHECCSGE